MINSATSYNEQLLDKRWLRKKTKILAIAACKCSACGSNSVQLNVHHLYYILGNDAWEYPNKALIVLCRDCHVRWHNTYKIEYRTKEWCKSKEYQIPIKHKRKRDKKCIIGTKKVLLTPLEKQKNRIRKRKVKTSSFTPIPEWRLKLKEQN